MQRNSLTRRTALSLTAGSVLASIGAVTASTTDGGVSRESFNIREGTDEETTVYVTTADADGPTAVILGGVHGNEVAGFTAAEDIADWSIDAGTLVTIPEASAVAVERGTRTDDEGNDLNRQFPEGSEPQTELAQALWDVVTDYDADAVIDLHESTGIYAGDPVDGVGQAIFHSSDEEATAAASNAIETVNEDSVDDPDKSFQSGGFTGPNSDPRGLLVHKASRELDAQSYLVETVSTDVDLDTRVDWQYQLVAYLLEDELFVNTEFQTDDIPAIFEEDPSETPGEDPEEEPEDDAEDEEPDESEEEPDDSEDEEPDESEEEPDDSEDEEPDESEEEPDDSEDEEPDESEEEPDEPADDEDDDADDEDADDEDDEAEDEDDEDEEDVDEDAEDDEAEDDEDEDEVEDEDDEDETAEPLTAEIETNPSDADDRTFDCGETVEFDASPSSTPNEEIVSYEWDLGGDGCIDETEECIDITIGSNGDHTVVLHVTDDAGEESTDEISLTTN
ncbi:PKD domain-containing protein [Natronorubrum sediminis]|uniref:PKD domain-containing protein n=1 Tax=Natronorubrum sediminis TaxID=640943 RepID=A0A1H6FNN9_9EURY|nr:PKD domain-containing protein [Natronorubrum sediminis]SEH11748.1 PKD domain-containing protein [Natronorubrum sediminis]